MPDAPVMTTESARPLSENDIQRVLKLQQEGKIKSAVKFSSDYEGGLDGPIDADAMAAPAIEKIKFKKSDLTGRWVHAMSDGVGVGVAHWEARGMRLATPDDVEVPMVRVTDNHFRWGSLILMVCPKSLMASALKAKDQRAARAVARETRTDFGVRQLSDALEKADPKDVNEKVDMSLMPGQIGRAKGPKGLSVFLPAVDES